MVDNIRDTIIQQGIQGGYKVSTINKVLRDNNQTEYNPLTYGKNYQNLYGNLTKNLQDIGRDIRTMGGVVAQPFIDTAKAPEGKRVEALKTKFKQAVNNEPLRRTFQGMAIGGAVGSALPIVGTAGGAIVGGLIGLTGSPKNLANTMLSTYNTNVDDIMSGKADWRDVAQGAMNNPLYTAIDITSLGGGKALQGVAKGVGSHVSKNAPMSLQAILPSKELRDFNRNITESIVASRAKRADVYNAYNQLNSSVGGNRLEMVKDIITNEGKLSKKDKQLVDLIKKDLKANEQEAISRGFLDGELSRRNTVAQYVMSKLAGRYPTLLHDDVVEFITNGTPSQRLRNILQEPKNAEVLRGLVEKGNRLYDDGKISFLTQALAPTRDPLGQVIANEINKIGEGYFGTKRIIGRTSFKDLADVLDESIKYQLDQIGRASEASDVINDVLSRPGIGRVLDKTLEQSKNYDKLKGFNEAYNKAIAKAIEKGEVPDIARAIKEAQSSVAGSYILDNVYSEALKNAFKTSNIGGLKKLSASFKKAVLANPHWIMLNRIGNWTNNAMGGVGFNHYWDATHKYKKYLPKQLAQQTSFNSYVGIGEEGLLKTPKLAVFKQPINNMKRGLARYNASNKSASELARLAHTLYTGTSDITANAFFRAESALERIDRYANFIKQAEDYAELVGKDTKDILKEASNNKKLFSKLNTEVNKDLGDYLGKNYALPQGWYDFWGEAVPFYRFLTQTGRTSLHQMVNHPLAFQSTVVAPAKAGHRASEDIIRQYNLDPEDYTGGVPYKNDEGNIRTIGTEPLPFQTVSEEIGDILSGKNITSITSPWLSLFNEIANYKKGGKWTPTSPRLTELKLTRPSEAKNYKPTLGEILRFGGNQILGSTNNLYRMGTLYAPDIEAALMGKPKLSRYDTNPFTDNPLSYEKQVPMEIVGKYMGIQTRSNFPKRQTRSKRTSRSDALTSARNRAKVKRVTERRKGNK